MIHCYLDKKDAKSTSNLHKHAKSCWGEPTVWAVDQAKSATEAHKKIVAGILWDGSITAAFEWHGKGKVVKIIDRQTDKLSKREVRDYKE